MATISWTNVEKIKQIILSCYHRREIVGKMGYSETSHFQHKKLNSFIKKHNIDISHFHKIPKRWKTLPDIIKHCYSYTDILRMLNLSLHGSNNETCKFYVKYFNLDISHFYTNGAIGGSDPKYTDAEVFCEDSKAQKGTMRLRYLKIRKDTYHCDECSLTTWRNKPITLEVEHKNGNSNDHRLANLSLLCPNCHSQTETYGSKKRADKIRKIINTKQ